MKKAYPGFAGLVKESVEAAGPRRPRRLPGRLLGAPAHPAPAGKITPKTPKAIYEELKENLEAAVKREGLL